MLLCPRRFKKLPLVLHRLNPAACCIEVAFVYLHSDEPLPHLHRRCSRCPAAEEWVANRLLAVRDQPFHYVQRFRAWVVCLPFYFRFLYSSLSYRDWETDRKSVV